MPGNGPGVLQPVIVPKQAGNQAELQVSAIENLIREELKNVPRYKHTYSSPAFTFGKITIPSVGTIDLTTSIKADIEKCACERGKEGWFAALNLNINATIKHNFLPGADSLLMLNSSEKSSERPPTNGLQLQKPTLGRENTGGVGGGIGGSLIPTEENGKLPKCESNFHVEGSVSVSLTAGLIAYAKAELAVKVSTNEPADVSWGVGYGFGLFGGVELALEADIDIGGDIDLS